MKKYTPGKVRGSTIPDIDELARRALNHYLENELDVFHVYPVRASGRGHSSDFRRCLAARITGLDAHGAGYYGPDGHSLNDTRKRLERQARAMGYKFVEVNPADWAIS